MVIFLRFVAGINEMGPHPFVRCKSPEIHFIYEMIGRLLITDDPGAGGGFGPVGGRRLLG
jgi:hypothetical protein